MSYLKVKTDSKNVVDAIHRIHSGVFTFSILICKIKNIMSFHSNFVIEFIKRQVNMVAYTLTRATIS
jgi:hypothetical protein